MPQKKKSHFDISYGMLKTNTLNHRKNQKSKPGCTLINKSISPAQGQ